MRTIYVYILADRKRQLSVGYTDDIRRDLGALKHSEKLYSEKLVYYETLPDVQEAVSRFTEIKHLSRKTQAGMIAAFNPHWDDLSGLWRQGGSGF